MTQMRVMSRNGMTLVYDTNDIESDSARVATPRDVIDTTRPGDLAVRRELGQAHLDLHLDFKPGKYPLWVPDEELEHVEGSAERLRNFALGMQRKGPNFVFAIDSGSAGTLRSGDIFSVLARLGNATACVAELEARLAQQEPAPVRPVAREPFVPMSKRPTSDMKLTPGEWCRAYGVRILDPDGWRDNDAPEWVEPITLVEFEHLASKSTTDAASTGWDGVTRDARLCNADAAKDEPTP